MERTKRRETEIRKFPSFTATPRVTLQTVDIRNFFDLMVQGLIVQGHAIVAKHGQIQQ
jgi:hypothetical protein